MKIIATLITRNRESVIAEAIASALPLVDEFVLVDMGVTDKTIENARAAVGDKPLHVHAHPWADDFAEARNVAQSLALLHGAKWQMTLDTDERMVGYDPIAVRQALQSAGEVVHVHCADGSYAKYRFFQMTASVGASGSWIGYTHEYYEVKPNLRVDTVDASLITFTEAAKPFDHYWHKLSRDVRLLQRCMTEKLPPVGRWHYYLGNTYLGVLRHWELYEGAKEHITIPHLVTKHDAAEHAVTQYQTAANLSGWVEERAFSYFQAACAMSLVGRDSQALALASKGFCEHPGYGECAWMAGFSAFQLKDYKLAENWARVASLLSSPFYQNHLVADLGLPPLQKHGFTDIKGTTDLPWNLWQWSLGAQAEGHPLFEVLDGLRLGRPPKTQANRRIEAAVGQLAAANEIVERLKAGHGFATGRSDAAAVAAEVRGAVIGRLEAIADEGDESRKAEAFRNLLDLLKRGRL